MLVDLYQRWEYRPIIKELSHRLKQDQPAWTLQKIAAAAGIQASFLTNVLKEKAHLSLDQLESLSLALKWDPKTTEYLGLLLDWERSGNSRRKERLAEKIEEMQKEQTKKNTPLEKEVVKHKIDEETKFFLSPKHFIVNSFLGIPKYAKAPEQIGKSLALSSAEIEVIVQDLIKIGAVARGPKGLEKLRRNFHLPGDSPLCQPHQALLQQFTELHLRQLPAAQKQSFRITFSADAKTRIAIHGEFEKFLKAIEPMVKAAPSETLYGLNFELFLWSQEA